MKMRLFGYRQKKEEKAMYVIAGLGNPTSEYERTRHNIGFDALDVLAQKNHIAINHRERRVKAETGTGLIAGEKVLLVKPLTFMNLSGEAIGPLLSYYKLDPSSQLIVLYDDINLDPGAIRIRKSGSAGGHNGMKDIIAAVGTQDFVRVRIGVGEKPAGRDLADYVLSRFSAEDRKAVDQALSDAAEAVELILRGETDQAMNRYNHHKREKTS